MKAVFFEANGLIYYRAEEQYYLRAFLEKHDIQMPTPQVLKEVTTDIHGQALRGQVSQDTYYDALLAACGTTDPELIRQGSSIS
jgi:hypothetical protein